MPVLLTSAQTRFLRGQAHGLRAILQVGGKEVSTPSDLAHAFDDAAAQKKQHVIALVRRDDQERFVALPVASG